MKGKRKVKTERKGRGQERGEKEQSKRKGRRDKEQLKREREIVYLWLGATF
jgi:hypothetical protein